ncbi:hypothetical protein TNIN_462351 [Trichonephila inaurata madagascariensis]|uniref:Uncharacterized protein n=1 Tax=Trichonephila inaurata madagascariensis TaxID=2747483 RepID=A0A8X7C748_9ARAC|nr:hypothetical protein TNIN_462351 [Trichonephila inaurata madagascariensis]
MHCHLQHGIQRTCTVISNMAYNEVCCHLQHIRSSITSMYCHLQNGIQRTCTVISNMAYNERVLSSPAHTSSITKIVISRMAYNERDCISRHTSSIKACIVISRLKFITACLSSPEWIQRTCTDFNMDNNVLSSPT